MRILRYICNHPEAWTLLILFAFLGARFRLKWTISANAFWIPPLVLGIAIICIYTIVAVEDRILPPLSSRSS